MHDIIQHTTQASIDSNSSITMFNYAKLCVLPILKACNWKLLFDFYYNLSPEKGLVVLYVAYASGQFKLLH